MARSLGQKNKARGTTFERELVSQLTAAGFPAKRAYCSNGESLGEVAQVDILILSPSCRIQAKRRKSLPQYLDIDEGVDIVVFREDHKKAKVLLYWEDYLILLQKTQKEKNGDFK
jgi:Holliday junction resolvase